MFVRRVGQPGDCEPILYLHGLGESGLCFERLARNPRLDGIEQLIPDLPGYGRSAWRDEPLSLVEIVDHVAEWLGDCGQRRVSLVGHSMGGVLAVLFAERHPDAVARLVDVDGNVSEPDCAFSGQAASMSLRRFCSGGFDEMRDRIYRDGVEDPALRGYYASLRLCDPRAYHKNSCELLATSRREDQATRLCALPMPALYVAGVPNGASPRSRALLNRAEVGVAEIGPAGHWPFLDQEDAFVAALSSFLKRSRAV